MAVSSEGLLIFGAGVVAGLVLRETVFEAIRSLRFFASQFSSFSADGTYNDANLVGVLRRNAAVPTLWMNLGYSEEVRACEHYPETAAALATKLGTAADLASAASLCDVGFGYGDQDLLWAERYPELTIVGFNIGPEQQRVARQRVAEAGLETRVSLRVGSATRLPLADGSVDRVTSLESAFHYDTREAFLEEAFRVLKPGGKLAVADILYEARPFPTLRGAHVLLYPLSFVLHCLLLKLKPHVPKANVYGLATLRAKLARVGFEAVAADDISEKVVIWNNARSRTFFRDWAQPLRHPSRLAPSKLERLLGLAVSAVDGGAAWNLYCFTCLNLRGLRYVLYVAEKPRD